MRRYALIGCTVGALALTLSACGSSSGSGGSGANAAGKTTAPKTTTTKAAAHSHDMANMPGMDHSATGTTGGHDMSNMHAVVPKAIPVLANGMLDATKVDLSGIPGVTPAEQARAENLLKITIEKLPQWADHAKALQAGFKSIGDGISGEEHLIHWDWINDNRMFDPDQPESLVYNTRSGTPVLEAAMYLVPAKYTLEHPPELGGKLTQFHIHDNLCFTSGDAPQVLGVVANPTDPCPPYAPVKFHPNLMVHVWIRANACGPFAALEGVGAGQVKPGDTKACDHQHGSASL